MWPIFSLIPSYSQHISHKVCVSPLSSGSHGMRSSVVSPPSGCCGRLSNAPRRFYCGVRAVGRRRSRRSQLRFHQAPCPDTKNESKPFCPPALSHHCVPSPSLQPADWLAQEWERKSCLPICPSQDRIIGFSVLELKIIVVSIPLPNCMILTSCSRAHTRS